MRDCTGTGLSFGTLPVCCRRQSLRPRVSERTGGKVVLFGNFNMSLSVPGADGYGCAWRVVRRRTYGCVEGQTNTLMDAKCILTYRTRVGKDRVCTYTYKTSTFTPWLVSKNYIGIPHVIRLVVIVSAGCNSVAEIQGDLRCHNLFVCLDQRGTPGFKGKREVKMETDNFRVADGSWVEEDWGSERGLRTSMGSINVSIDTQRGDELVLEQKNWKQTGYDST